jgi:hypothetical protein
MKEGLNHAKTTLQVMLIAAMLSASFMAINGFFNALVTSTQYSLEIICLLTSLLLISAFLSQKKVSSKTDLLVPKVGSTPQRILS